MEVTERAGHRDPGVDDYGLPVALVPTIPNAVCQAASAGGTTS